MRLVYCVAIITALITSPASAQIVVSPDIFVTEVTIDNPSINPDDLITIGTAGNIEIVIPSGPISVSGGVVTLDPGDILLGNVGLDVSGGVTTDLVFTQTNPSFQTTSTTAEIVSPLDAAHIFSSGGQLYTIGAGCCDVVFDLNPANAPSPFLSVMTATDFIDFLSSVTNFGAVISGSLFDVDGVETWFNIALSNIPPDPIPLPAPLLLFASGLAGLFGIRRVGRSA